MEREKQSRAPNYSTSEKETLLRLVASQKHIIENKKTDSSSTEEKKTAWEKVALDFNSMSPGMAQRSVDSLKKFYNNQKEQLRKRLGNEQKEIYRTGGGAPPPPPERDGADKILISIVSEKTLYGVQDSVAPYDDDYNILDKKNEETSNNLYNSRDEAHSIKETITSYDIAGPSRRPSISMLKAPLNKILKKNINKVQNTQTENGIQILVQDDKEDSVKLLQSQDETTISSFKRRLSSQIVNKNERKKIISNKSRRRPTIVKTLTTSRLGEQYETLIEKKLELLEGLNKEHKVRLQILELKKQIKQEELKRIMQGAEPNNSFVQGSDLDHLIGESVEWTV